MPLLSCRCPWSWLIWTGGRTRWQAWNHDGNEVLRVALYPNPVFNEMCFLTVDPFVGVPVFIAKLSKRQYCWRVIEDFHSQEYIQFFDIHCCLFMRLHFSIGVYDYRRTTRFRQNIHFSIISSLRIKSWCKQAPIFRRWEECCFVFSPLILTHFWPASTLLREHLALAILSPPETDPQILELWVLRWWGSPGQIIPSEGFWSRILVWRATAFMNFTRWIGFCMSELFRKVDDNFGGSISWKTQPNCRVLDELHITGPWFNSWRLSRFTTGCPVLSWLLSWFTRGCHVLSCRSYFFNMATALLSPFFRDLLLGCSSTWRCA